MRICFLCSEYPPSSHGGIGTFVQVLARALVREGHEVRVVGIYPQPHDASDYEDDQGVQVWRLRGSQGRFTWPWNRYKLWKQVSSWARQGKIDLVEAPDWEGMTAFWPKLPVPVIVRLHGSVSYFQREINRPIQRSVLILEKSALRRASAWCSVSRYTAEKTKAIFALKNGPDAILYNPIETDWSDADKPRTSQQVIFTGTLTFKKGIVSLVKAWPMVKQACPMAELHIFGKDGRTFEGGSMLKHLTDLTCGDMSCFFHGHVSRQELFDAFAKARVAVFPSYAEAFAVAPLESMTKGCPTIYSRRGSGPELIEDGINGLLIDPDQPSDIANGIIRVLQDDSLARQLSQAGRERVVNHFSIGYLTKQNIDFYGNCIERFQLSAA
jgi:glycosyltransferase involved in cell wall biosynthesis